MMKRSQIERKMIDNGWSSEKSIEHKITDENEMKTSNNTNNNDGDDVNAKEKTAKKVRKEKKN